MIHQQVSVIAALTTPSAIAAKVATATIPIVFTTIGDPMQIGLVASLSRPGGNLTGVTILNVEIVPKMLELLHQVVPTATTTAVLVNPTNPNAETLSTSLQVAARTLGLELNVLRASTERDIDKPFATLIPLRVGGLTRNRLRTGGKPSARLSPPIWRRCASATLHPPRRPRYKLMTLATDEAGGHVHPSLGVRQQTRNQATSEIRYPQTGSLCHAYAQVRNDRDRQNSVATRNPLLTHGGRHGREITICKNGQPPCCFH